MSIFAFLNFSVGWIEEDKWPRTTSGAVSLFHIIKIIKKSVMTKCLLNPKQSFLITCRAWEVGYSAC